MRRQILISVMVCIALIFFKEYQVPAIMAADEKDALVLEINTLRKELGLSELVYDEDLEHFAELRAVECSYYWSHTRPNGLKWATIDDDFDFHIYRGENLARGDDPGDADTIYQAWLNSSDHYHTMTIADFNKIGIGRYYNPTNHKYTWVAGFGL